MPDVDLQLSSSSGPTPLSRKSLPFFAWLLIGLVIGGGVVFAATAIFMPKPKATEAPVALTPTNETISIDSAIDYSAKIGGVRDYPAKIAMSVPIEWRAQTTLTGDHCGSQLFKMETCFGLQLADVIGQPKQLIGTNSFELRNITDWLTSDTPGAGAPYGVELAKHKKARVDLLFNAENSDDLKQYKKLLLTSFPSGAPLGNFAHLERITTTDGQFSGYLAVDSVASSPAYVPMAFAVMVGKFKDQTMLVQAKFDLHDVQRDALKNETDNTKGSKIDLVLKNAAADKFPSDTLGLVGPIKTALASFHLSER